MISISVDLKDAYLQIPIKTKGNTFALSVRNSVSLQSCVCWTVNSPSIVHLCVNFDESLGIFGKDLLDAICRLILLFLEVECFRINFDLVVIVTIWELG